MATPIVIDCDPGHDDAVAILLALASPALAGRPDIPVAAGAAHPLRGPLHTAPQVHGESGLDGPALPPAASEPQEEGPWRSSPGHSPPRLDR